MIPKNVKTNLGLILCLMYSPMSIKLARAANIDIKNTRSSQQRFKSSNQTLTISEAGNLVTDKNHALIKAHGTNMTGVKIIIEANEGNGVHGGHGSYPAINISRGANLELLDLRSGQITSNHVGLLLNGSGTTTVNTAAGTTIETTGISILNGTPTSNDLTINNAGSIISQSQRAIHDANRGDSRLTINNDGLIQGVASIRVVSTNARKDAIINNNHNGVINGRITFKGNRDATAIITNHGVINGNITSRSDFNDLDIINHGTINGNIRLGQYSGASFTMHDGILNGRLYLDAAQQQATLHDGIINGKIILAADSQVNLGDTTINGNIDGSSDYSGHVNLTKSADIATNLGATKGLNSVNLAADQAFTLSGKVNTENLTIASGATLDLQSDITAHNTTLSGTLDFSNRNTLFNGNIHANAGRLKLGNGRHHITGDITLGTGDHLDVILNSDNDYGNVTVNGISTVASNTNLNVTTSSSYEFIADGTQYVIIQGQDGSSIQRIQDEHINVNNSASNTVGLVSFSTRNANNSLTLHAKRKAATQITQNESAQEAYNAIVNIGANATGELKTFQEFLDSSTTTENAASSLESATIQDRNTVITGQMNTINDSLSTIENRIDEVRIAAHNVKKSSGISTGDDEQTHGIWAQAFGSQTKQKNINSTDGYDASASGVAFGYDKRITPKSVLGLSLSYATSDIDSANRLKSTNIDIYQINGYGEYLIHNYFIDGILGFSWNDYNSNRAIAGINTMAFANYSGQSYISKIRTGYMKDLGGFILMPQLSLNYLYNKKDGYIEEGAGTMNLIVNANNSSALEGTIGMSLTYPSRIFNHTINSKIGTSYGYNFLNKQQSTVSSFLGQDTSFVNLSSKTDPRSLNANIGLDIKSKNGFTISGEYIAQKRQKYFSHLWTIKGRYEF